MPSSPEQPPTPNPGASVSSASVSRDAAPKEPPSIDRHRYRKVRWFLAKVFLQALWWDLILGRRWLSWLRRDPVERYAEIARRYRALAVEMGGVLIKLGQFLSIRVDVLPPEVTRELAGLQDRVPPEDFSHIRRQLRESFEEPLEEIFEEIQEEPLGAASLAQVHRARLAGGEKVVVKVLRPGIRTLVETDLAAVDLGLSWLSWIQRVRKRVDLERLAEEFRRTTLRELDLVAEAGHAERFAELFADDEQVRIPAVHHAATRRRVLTLENVGFLKVADREALEAAGIEPGAVARKLYRVYMRQIFEHDFVHADPHPGNLFVEPLPTTGEAEAGLTAFEPGQTPPAARERPFRVVFVDFGMTATVPVEMRGALREFLIAFATRDAKRIVRAAQDAGVLLPGANLERLEEIHREVFDRFWGIPMGRLREEALSQAPALLRRYRDLIYEMPFQVPVDMLFASRAVGILSGLCTSLDPDFDPWAETLPFAEGLAAREARLGLEDLVREIARQGRALLTLPEDLRRTLEMAREGELTLDTRESREMSRALGRLERSQRRLAWIVAASALLVAGVLAEPTWAIGGLLGLSGLAFLWGILRWR